MTTYFINANVWTGDDTSASAFGVCDGKFTYVGDTDGALSLANEGDHVVDMADRFVCPGFNDSHMHLLSFGLALRRARLNEHTGSLRELISYFHDFGAQMGANERGWLVGRGWNQDYFSDEKRMPNRWDLDEVSATLPVAAVRCCGHCAVVNSKALEIMGITTSTPAPEGGAIGTENGQLDGRFYDTAIDMIFAHVPGVDVSDVKQMILAACHRYNACGVTSVQTDDYATPWRVVNEAYRQLMAEGQLTVRVYEQCNFTSEEALSEFITEGHVTDAGSDMFRIGPLKLVADGALGARTACLSVPYADDPGNTGLMLFTQAQLDGLIALANRHDMQVAVHCIGDRCLDMTLDAIDRALNERPRADHRHGIVHCQITRADQLRRMMDMHMQIYAQSIFLDYDSRIVRDRVGGMADTSYSWKTLMQGGLNVSNGTDCPVEQPDALRGIQCAVTRASLNGGEPYLPQQAFTVDEALTSYTSAGAHASFEENIKGRIRVGQLADFVALSRSPFDVPAHEIQHIQVTETYLGGRKVWPEA